MASPQESETSSRLLAAVTCCDVPGVDSGKLRRALKQVAQLGHRSLLLVLSGDGELWEQPGGAPTADLIRALGVVYDVWADTDARAHVVPLVPCAGWDADAITSLQDVQRTPPQGPDDDLHASAVAGAAAAEPILLPHVIVPSSEANAGQPASLPGSSLLFDHVAVGGTFDRLHAGHELLLAVTALVARKAVYIGITADKLLAKKNHREMLQPYHERRKAAVSFMRGVRPGLSIEAGALSDPQEPTQAELDPAMQAIVVSVETLPGAVQINNGRAARGFTPLTVIVVPVIGCQDGQPGTKLSSTQLRAQDAAAAAAAATGAVAM